MIPSYQRSVFRCALVGLLLFAGVFLIPPSSAQDIVALCIGNDAYIRDEDQLDTPVADATLMSETLRAIPGVREQDVILLKDGTRESIRVALRQFREKAREAKLSIVFYSGHGMEDQPTGYDRAETFLLPVDAEIETADHLPDRAVGLGEVLGVFKGLGPGGRVVVLDCCRTGAPSATNALAGAGKNVSEDLDARVARALGQAELSEGTLVSFSAGPGRKAAAFLKDTDAYSPFTHFLAKGIREEGGDLFGILSRATATTREATGGRQIPRVRFDGDPSLITAVTLGASRPVVGVQTAPVTPPENSAQMAALLARVEAAERLMAVQRELIAETEEAKKEAERRAAGMSTTPVPTSGAFSASRGMEGSRAGEVREFGGIEMVWCPPGEFMMGSPASEADRSDDETQHRVTLTKGFWLAKTETTQGQWESVMGTDVTQQKAKGDSYGEVTGEGATHPMYFVNWDDAQQYLVKMNGQQSLPSGWKWVLPTEAQWEYACRAGTTTALAGELDEMGWYGDNSGSKTNPVGTKKANAWGLHDMHGNVWEWCLDWYGDYPSGSSSDPKGSTTGSARVDRGGGWNSGAQGCRAALRYWFAPSVRGCNLGFRPALSSLPAR